MTQAPPPIPQPTPPQRKGWWGRNWKWALPVGCLTPVLVCGGMLALIFGVVFGAIRSSDVYRESVARAQSSAAVVTALGSPVQTGSLVSGSINVNGSSGDANLAIPIHGPGGRGTIHAVAAKSDGKWHFSSLRVQVEGQAEQIDLLHNAGE